MIASVAVGKRTHAFTIPDPAQLEVLDLRALEHREHREPEGRAPTQDRVDLRALTFLQRQEAVQLQARAVEQVRARATSPGTVRSPTVGVMR